MLGGCSLLLLPPARPAIHIQPQLRSCIKPSGQQLGRLENVKALLETLIVGTPPPGDGHCPARVAKDKILSQKLGSISARVLINQSVRACDLGKLLLLGVNSTMV